MVTIKYNLWTGNHALNTFFVGTFDTIKEAKREAEKYKFATIRKIYLNKHQTHV